METADPLSPSSKTDESEDLIEELARLMADDAQISAPPPVPPKPVFSGVSGQVAPKTATQQQAGQQNEPAAPSAQSASHSDMQNKGQDHQPPGQTAFPEFDLGAPKAEVSHVPAQSAKSASTEPTPAVPPVAEQEPAASAQPANVPDKTSAPDEISASIASLSTPDTQKGGEKGNAEKATEPLDFDFGFGISPDASVSGKTAPINAPVDISSAPKTENPAAQDDAIAALINSVAAEHGAEADDTRMSAAQLASAELPLDAPEPSQSKGADGFKTPPVFGVEGNAKAEQPASEPTDPAPASEEQKPIGGSNAFDQIDSLIGHSINVAKDDLSAQQAVEGPVVSTSSPEAHQRPAPASIAPMSGSPDKVASDTQNAERSILESMAEAGTASAQHGASTENSPTPTTESRLQSDSAEPLLAGGRVKTQVASKKKRPAFLLPLVGLLLVGVVGYAGYSFLNASPENEEAPVLQADTTPSREAPAPVETPEPSVVLNEIDGDVTPPQNEQLVSRDETGGATGANVRQVITQDSSDAGLANRRVRTVTVRPDGTIVSGTDTAAGSQILPVAQPNLPDLPADAVNTDLTNTTVAALPDSASALLPADSGASTGNANLVTVNGDSVPFPRPALTNRAALRTAALQRQTQPPQSTGVSSDTQNNIENLINNGSSSTAPGTPVNVAPAATTAPAASTNTNTTSVANARAYVQLASQRSQSVANQTASTMQSRYASALRGGRLVVRRVDLGTRGIYYRVQLPASSLSEANAICSSIKNAGGDCFTRNN